MALIAAVALSIGVLGIGHHHEGDTALDEHHCALCHVQPIHAGPALDDVGVPAVVPHGSTLVGVSGPAGRLASRLSPPLRGPPAR